MEKSGPLPPLISRAGPLNFLTTPRPMKSPALLLLPLLAASLGLSSCGPGMEATQLNERAKLLNYYPLGSKRADLFLKFGHPPQESVTRPAKGWATEPREDIRQEAQEAEARTGKRIKTIDTYMGASGPIYSLGLARTWYYYDPSDRLVDLKWRHRSD